MTAREGYGPDTPTCSVCDSYLQAWRTDRWRCIWTRASETPPDEGPWCCTWPRLGYRADLARAYGVQVRTV